jgi:hypothetical protein
MGQEEREIVTNDFTLVVDPDFPTRAPKFTLVIGVLAKVNPSATWRILVQVMHSTQQLTYFDCSRAKGKGPLIGGPFWSVLGKSSIGQKSARGGKAIPQGLKPATFAALTARLKPCPSCENRFVPQRLWFFTCTQTENLKPRSFSAHCGTAKAVPCLRNLLFHRRCFGRVARSSPWQW